MTLPINSLQDQRLKCAAVSVPCSSMSWPLARCMGISGSMSLDLLYPDTGTDQGCSYYPSSTLSSLDPAPMPLYPPPTWVDRITLQSPDLTLQPYPDRQDRPKVHQPGRIRLQSCASIPAVHSTPFTWKVSVDRDCRCIRDRLPNTPNAENSSDQTGSIASVTVSRPVNSNPASARPGHPGINILHWQQEGR